MPKVSVIIPTYNRANYICDAIESVLNQTYNDFEIIIVDDGSVDNTKEILKKYEGRIKCFYKENGNPASARNFGIQRSKGEYIAFLDSDDIWLPEKLELQIDYFNRNTDFSLVFTEYQWFKNGRDLKKSNFRKYRPCDGFVLKESIRNPCSALSSFLFKREVFDVILFDEAMIVGEGSGFIVRIAQKFKIGLIDKALVKVRVHNSNISKEQWLAYKNNIQLMYTDHLKILNDVFLRYPELISQNSKDINAGLSLLFLDYGKDLYCLGKSKEARIKFIKSLQLKFNLGSILNLLKTLLPRKLINYLKNKRILL